MSNNLRSVLGLPRVQKKKAQKKKQSSSTTSSLSWTSSLQRTKPSASGLGSTTSKLSTSVQDNGITQREQQRGSIPGLILPGGGGNLDISRAQAYTLARMFESIPDRGSGMNSVKIANVLNTRKAIPLVSSTAHLEALVMTLGGNQRKSPTAAEREIVEAVRDGVLRRVVLPERKNVSGKGGKVTGDLVILARDLEGMVESAPEGLLREETKEKFLRWLRANPTAQRMQYPSEEFKNEELDALVRVGFLTSVNDNVGRLTGVYARPEDRVSMLSLEVVSRAAAGSIAAVGGDNALHDAGGTGGARSTDGIGKGGPTGTFSVAVPGAGLFLKLVSGALERMEELLERGQDWESPVDGLREKWDGGVASDRTAGALAKKDRGEFVGILPGRTKKWKDFHGLSFDWILQEAIGAGLVEVFETGSVGLGVRLLT